MAEEEMRSVVHGRIAELTAGFEASTRVRGRWRYTLCWASAFPASWRFLTPFERREAHCNRDRPDRPHDEDGHWNVRRTPRTKRR